VKKGISKNRYLFGGAGPPKRIFQECRMVNLNHFNFGAKKVRRNLPCQRYRHLRFWMLVQWKTSSKS